MICDTPSEMKSSLGDTIIREDANYIIFYLGK